jgi:hypothetical protein
MNPNPKNDTHTVMINTSTGTVYIVSRFVLYSFFIFLLF